MKTRFILGSALAAVLLMWGGTGKVMAQKNIDKMAAELEKRDDVAINSVTKRDPKTRKVVKVVKSFSLKDENIGARLIEAFEKDEEYAETAIKDMPKGRGKAQKANFTFIYKTDNEKRTYTLNVKESGSVSMTVIISPMKDGQEVGSVVLDPEYWDSFNELLMASCSSESEYANAIPKDAAMVMSFDFKTMAEKSGINGKGGEKVVAKLTDALKSGLEGEAYKTAEKIIQNPSESGLSFTDKVYMFITPHSNAFALLAKVDDEGKVEALLEALKNEQICTELKSESGCTWTQMGTALCAFNKGTFLLMGSNKGDALSLKGSLLSLMRQDAENSYVKTTDFGKLASSKGEIVTVMNMSFIPNDITMQMRMGMPAYLKLEDIKYLVSATFEKGKIVVKMETLIENKDLIAMYEKQSAVSALIKGAYLEYFPANMLVWAGGNIDGKGIYDLLCENPTIKQALDNPMLPIDIEGIFSSIHGDVAVGYSSLSNNDLLIYADVTNKDFLQSFEDLRPLLAMTGGQMQLNSTGKDQYEFRMYRQSIWFGVKDNLLYISNNERLADEAGRRYGVSLQNTPWAGEVVKNRFFMAFNAVQLVKDVQENPRLTRMLGSDAAVFNAILGSCDYVDVMAPDWRSGQINIVMKDKEVNVLQLIVHGLENL